MTKSSGKSESKSKVASSSKSDGASSSGTGTGSETKAAGSEAKAKDTASSKTGGATTDSGKDAPKSARESVGGASEVHYGYFSNVKTPAYRSGWDGIWGTNNGGKKSAKRKAPEPISLSLNFDNLPSEIRDGLAEIARAELKKRRISYDRRASAGAVEWRIECQVRR